MINLAICDDDVRELDKTVELCHSYALQHKDMDIRIDRFSSGTALLEQMTEGQNNYDVMLLDIYMPDMTGIELAKYLRARADNCQIIFLTTSLGHAIEAFTLHATHYLVKPYTREQLGDALDKAVSAVDKIKKANILIKNSNGIQRINLSDIIYSETEKHLQNIHLGDGTCLQVRITSSELYDMLCMDKRFYKCGSTYILNLDKIKEITAKHILFSNHEELPMQRRQYKELVELYTRYLLDRL
ncbi:MAG: putative two-component response regulator [Firmicutes bacterium]|nr:putative two-component response regulator [Bacillota bacterium]